MSPFKSDRSKDHTYYDHDPYRNKKAHPHRLSKLQSAAPEMSATNTPVIQVFSIAN